MLNKTFWVMMLMMIPMIMITGYEERIESIKKEKPSFYEECYFNQTCFDHIYIYGESKYVPEKKKMRMRKKRKFNNLYIIYDHFKKGPFKKMALEITAMSALETDFWRSDFHNDRQNYWSRKKLPNGINCINWEKNCLITHTDIFTACYEMEAYLKRKGYNQESVDEFLLDLKRKNFAEDPKYIKKVERISEDIYNILF